MQSSRGDLSKLHRVLTEIAAQTAEICRRLGLRYYLAEGSLLGAVRHGGIIPWDDDVDFAMPRPDYDRFIREAPALLPERFRITTYETGEGALRWFLKVEDTGTRVVCGAQKEESVLPAWVDVFPLDGLPDFAPLRKYTELCILIYRALMQFSQFDQTVDIRKRGRPAHERFLIWAGKMLPLERALDTRALMRGLDRMLRRYDYDRRKYCINAASAYKSRSVMPGAWYGQGQDYEFEGYLFRGPDKPDPILRRLYGDYMTLPPAERRNTHQTRVLDADADLTAGKDDPHEG